MPCPKINIKGIGGQLDATGYGTIKFNILNDHGKTHELVVHNVLYVPNSPVNLFSPQRFARDDESNGMNGTCSLTGGTNSHFIWNHSKYIKSIHHPMQWSLPILHVNEGFNAMAMFNQFRNPMVCTVIDEGPNRPVSFDGSGDTIIPDISDGCIKVAGGPTVVEDISDEASQCSSEVKPLSLAEVGHEPDLLPNLEEDMDEVKYCT